MFKDLTGKKFGRLLVISKGEKTKYGYKWNCVCDCGNKIKVLGANLRKNNTLSCGCYQKDRARETQFKHGDSKRNSPSRLYRCWSDMKTRTTNTRIKSAARYSKRGITLCDEWKDFMNFKKWAIKNGYEDGLTIDRIDVNGDYCPENCRWATKQQQQRNKANTVKYKKIPVTELCEKYGIKYHTVMARVYLGIKRGFTRNQIFKQCFPEVK